ncbi:MAG: hypothetical protein H6R15_2864 [Proteobacteria bacterium]|nr:hypothetical protein [Pseudomonadota bacterium]
MLILSDFTGDYKDGYNTTLNLERYSEDGDTVFFYGIQCGVDKKLLTPYKDYRRKILLDLWSPCAFFTDPNHFSILEGFDEVYSICPYTTEWTNEQLGRKLMRYSFYPVTPETIVPQAPTNGFKKLLNKFSSKPAAIPNFTETIGLEKKYDICYVGGLYSPEHIAMMEIVSKFKYAFVTQNKEKKATHRNLSNADKINLVAQCKIGICFNKLYPTEDHIANIKNYSGWQDNRAFDHLFDPISIAPQIKTRLHELALCKTLILCHRDPWNLVEDYYEPGKDFVYFDKIEDLKTLIPEILANFDAYQNVIDSAYLKVNDYSSRQLVNMVRTGAEFGHVTIRDK